MVGYVKSIGGRTFSCNQCNFVSDADLNASLNLRLDLAKIPAKVRLQKMNLTGFYWSSEGLSLVDQEPIVPDSLIET